MFAFVLAVAVLMVLEEGPDVPFNDPLLTALEPYIREIAVEQELIRPTDLISVYPYCIQNLRRMRYQLYDAPYVDDLNRWPKGGEVQARLKYCTNYRNMLEGYTSWPEPVAIRAKEAWQACERIREAYDLLDDAQGKYISQPYIRLKLKALRKLIGEEDYYAGRLPPVIPYTEFKPF